MVVWLDELQRYLDGEHGLTGGVVRALLNAPDPVVIIGTLWPDRYTAYTVLPAPGGADPHAREREVLDLADVIRIAPEFSPAEQDRARAAAARDPRLRVALEAAGYGLTQTLAAAPQLVARWEDAQAADPYAWAVLTAALDAARLGARAPLSADFLRAAAPGYCTSQQQAEAPGNWFEQALAYATSKLHGAAAALAPAGAGMGQIAGYTVADYLIQHASRERRSARVPASTWDALLSHIRDPADAARLADSAESRLLYRYAIPLYRHAADAGDGIAAASWPACWPGAGTWTSCAPGPTPATRTPPGGWPTCWPSAGTWTSCAPAPTPATSTPPGSWPACWPSAATWTSCAPAPTPATGTPPGGWPACWPSAGTWTRPSRSCAPAPTPATGTPPAAGRAAGRARGPGRAARPRRRRRRGRRPGAGRAAGRARGPGRAARPGRRRRRVRRRAAGRPAGRARGPGRAARPRRRRRRVRRRRLAGLLAERGDLDEAEQILRARADAGDRDAAWELADLLAERGTWTSCAPAPTPATETPPGELAGLLAERGDLDELRARADAGDEYAAREAGRPAGQARGPGPAARPRRRRRRVRRRPAGRPAGRARGPGPGRADPARRGRCGRPERPAASCVAHAAGPLGRSRTAAPVRPRPRRVDCQRVRTISVAFVLQADEAIRGNDPLSLISRDGCPREQRVTFAVGTSGACGRTRLQRTISDSTLLRYGAAAPV